MEAKEEKKTSKAVPPQDVPNNHHQTITIEDVSDEEESINYNPLIDEDIKKIAEQAIQDSTLCDNIVLIKIYGSQSFVSLIPIMPVVSIPFVGTQVVEAKKAEGDSIFSSLPTLEALPTLTIIDNLSKVWKKQKKK